MKFAKPIAIVLGVLVVGVIAVAVIRSNAEEREHRERMETLDKLEAMQKNLEATQDHMLDAAERAAAISERSQPAR